MTDHHQTETYGSVQWKGTDVCLDFYCACGKHSHFDDDFCYFIVCPFCRQVYALSPRIAAKPVTDAELNGFNPRESNSAEDD